MLRSQSRLFKCFAKRSCNTKVPGLFLIKNFLDPNEIQTLLQKCHTLRAELTTGMENSTKEIISFQHNLPSKEVYRKVLVNGESVPLNAQVFPKYGDPGHLLAYFIGHSNLPSWTNPIVSKIRLVGAVADWERERDSKLSLAWRMTFNHYQASEARLAGFPFHRDLAANGEITSILTVKQSAEIQLIKPNFDISDGIQTEELLKTLTKQVEENEVEHVSLLLEPGSLLVLSGEGRWNWLHRVLPQPGKDKERLSLVFGVQ